MEIVHNKNKLIDQNLNPPDAELKLYDALDKLPQPRKHFSLSQDQKIL